jgi:uncharacterized protein involved in response to NO
MRAQPTTPRSLSREPYRALFPLGAALAGAAVLPFAIGGAAGSSLALFHSVAQVQGFLTCFLVGFCYTSVPRHTGTAAPAPWQLVAAVLLPVLSVSLAFDGRQTLAQGTWLVLVAVVVEFTARRLVRAGGTATLEPVLVWIPLSLLAGVGGASLIAASSRVELQHGLTAWTIGRGLLVQGFVAGLVIGMAGVLLPRPAPAGSPPAARGRGGRRRALAWHGFLALAFFSSFPLEVLAGVRAGAALRAVVSLAALVQVARIHRPPAIPGLHGWLVWMAAWLVPLGFCLGALAPRWRGAALHVVFVGGFAQIMLAMSAHVVQVLGGPPARRGGPWASCGMAAFLTIAFAGRILAGIDLAHVPRWLSLAAIAFTGALAAWGVVVGRVLVRRASGAADVRSVPP